MLTSECDLICRTVCSNLNAACSVIIVCHFPLNTYPHAGLLPAFATFGIPLALNCVLFMEAIVALVALVAGNGLFSSSNG